MCMGFIIIVHKELVSGFTMIIFVFMNPFKLILKTHVNVISNSKWGFGGLLTMV
jgi:hypothetical protein